MDVVVSVRHFELNDAIKQHAVNAVTAAFEEFRLKIGTVNLVLDMQRNMVKASISVNIKDFPIGAESDAYDNVYKAIDDVISRVESQARRYLDKKQDHRATGLAAAEKAKADEANR